MERALEEREERRRGRVALLARLLAVGAVGLVAAAVALRVGGAAAPSHPHSWFIAVVYCLLGERVVAHAQRNPVGWCLLATGVSGALAVGATVLPDQRWLAWVGAWAWWPTYSLLPVVLLLFPTGRPPGRRWWAAVGVAALGVLLPVIGIGWAAWGDPASFWQQVFTGTARRGVPVAVAAVGFAAFVAALCAAMASLVVRGWRAPRGAQRRGVWWVLAGSVVFVPALGLELAFGEAWGAWLAAAAAFPVAVVIAIMRYGLYDIELILHRTLLYGFLGALLIGVYSAVVLVTTMKAPTDENVIATVVVVASLAPLYKVLLRGVNRALYGARSDPYGALVELGRTLAHPMRRHELLPAVVTWVGKGLKLPYVAVHLDLPDSEPSAVHGAATGSARHSVVLKHQGRRIGLLVAEARSRGEALGRRDVRLLEDMAGQAAPAVHSARMALALDEADARFERERREELRRIGNDLHDYIGPSVVGIGKQMGVALRTLDQTGSRARALIEEAVEDLEALTGTVRQVVRNARALDLGPNLAQAVRRRAESFADDVEVHVTATGRLDDVPPAVARAAFLIAGEALLNVVRHAEAAQCRISLTRNGSALEVSVADDGRGMPEELPFGIGLASMKERCTGLGGDFSVDHLAPGTRITALIPFEMT
ncbi:sensor histidine kinase [Saccharothrix sp. HUAS TT1]|uniref:sensor histidine kinase n=1 Tax=unclassified Saccharothrix TaxID=2593673 RepID=UPI00345C0A73